MSDTTVWTVSQLNQAAKQLLEQNLASLRIRGELSNFKTYASGHWYFTLKDEQAQVSGVMFRGNNQRVSFKPQDGQQVEVSASTSLYTPSGNFQVVVRSMRPAGQGDLLLKLEQLKKRLFAEGLFADERKKPLPAFPKRLGVITSSSGAAFHDILKVLKQRHPQLEVLLYPASVQGNNAAAELLEALNLAIARNDCDVLIIGRGGGSFEDLFAFNDEALTRAVANCPVPIVSAVGHEVDFSLTDFAADVRAATPSHAAELVAPDRQLLLHKVEQWQARLTQQLVRQVQQLAEHLNRLTQRLSTPERLLAQQQAGLADWQLRLERAFDVQYHRQAERLHHLARRLDAQKPTSQLTQQAQQLKRLQQRLNSGLSKQQQRLQQHQQQYQKLLHQLTFSIQQTIGQQARQQQQLLHRLHMASPDILLERGYSITLLGDNSTVVQPTTPLPEGTLLHTRLAGNRTIASQVIKSPG